MTVPAPPQDTEWKEVQLFGGAISAKLPQRFGDISDVQPVPDHQEVWGDPATDQSIIVEVTEPSAVPDAEVGSFVFDDLVGTNEASSSSITSIQQLDASSTPRLPPGTYAVLVTGAFAASKAHQPQAHDNTVLLLLAVLRFPQHGADLLVSLNAPLVGTEGGGSGSSGGVQPAAQQQGLGVMQGVLSSLCVTDWGLFGGEL